MRFVWPLFVLLASSTGLLAQSRYEIDGNTLTLDMTVAAPGYDFDGGLDAYNETEVISYLFDHPEIKTLRVTGPGGYGPAARAISDYLLRHSINTVAFGECYSACARIFLGGKSRMLAPGATLGFHRPWIVKESEKRFYEANRIKEKWEEEFDYVPWIYDVAIGDVVEGLTFLRSRDVEMDFILKIYSTSSYDIWEPSRDELLEAGVLTE
ncbi:hypothetical protein PQY68_05930 [Planktomarina temperata]|nr:hypothetical protein [Planktomarina temperata]MDC6454766.1 hypothetical protein [Planktomarina temperata]